MNNPVISVIMPVFNCESFIAEAVESILNQTFGDFELIIIDDHSADSTASIIEGYRDKRIKLLKKPRNSGYIDSLNLGIEISKGDFIARMDGDDVSLPTRLEKQIGFLNSNPDVFLCGTWYQLLSSGEIVEKPVHYDDIKMAFLDYCAIGHPTVILRKSFWVENKLWYDQDFYPAEDYELWTRIIGLGKIANIPEALLLYRSHPNQVSAKDGAKQFHNTNRCRIRMICYPFTSPTQHDLEMGELIVLDKKPVHHTVLSDLITWLDRLAQANLLTNFYNKEKFSTYIENEKRLLIRTFYMYTTSCNPVVWRQFVTSPHKFKRYFTPYEFIKFTAKCMLFYKTRFSPE